MAKRKAATQATKPRDAMLDFLFRRLTADTPRGTDLFERVTEIAREPHWFVEGTVPDTLDGRFAVLATITALVLVRLEADGERGDAISVALTERFIAVMESEHRELGLGDPSLGKTVRKLVGSLSRRTDLWRSTTSRPTEWAAATSESLYKGHAAPDAVAHSAAALERLWTGVKSVGLDQIAQGKLQ